MGNSLAYLKSLSRDELLTEIRRATENPDILLWELVGYGDMYEPVRAGPETAAALGLEGGEVIGYVLLVPRPMGSAIGDLMNSVRQDEPPYPDPFES
jgi:hypothetical protein